MAKTVMSFNLIYLYFHSKTIQFLQTCQLFQKSKNNNYLLLLFPTRRSLEHCGFSSLAWAEYKRNSLVCRK